MNNVFSKKKVLLSDIYNSKEAIITATKEAVHNKQLLFDVCVKKKSITFSLSTCFCSSSQTLVPTCIGAKSVDTYPSNLSVMGGSKNELFYSVYYKGKPFMVLTVGFNEVGFLYEEEIPYVEPAPEEPVPLVVDLSSKKEFDDSSFKKRQALAVLNPIYSSAAFSAFWGFPQGGFHAFRSNTYTY